MKQLIAVAVALTAITSASFSMAQSESESESLTFGVALSQQGCIDTMGVEPTQSIHLAYQKTTENFDVDAYVKRAPRGADCRQDGVTVDLSIERKFDLSENAYVNVELGYDQHGVTGFDKMNMLVFGSVKQETAAIGIGRTFGTVEIDVGWNVPTAELRYAVETTILDVELSADYSAGYQNGSATYVVDLNEKWGVRFTARHSSGFDKLPDPFSGRADAPATNESNTFEIGVNYEF